MTNSLSILLDNPMEAFTPGSTVSGKVVFNNKDAKKSKFITLKAQGLAKIWFNKYNGQQAIPYTDRRSFFEFEESLWKSASGNKEELPGGESTWPFSFTLPKDCPPTFKALNGSIKYTVEVEVHQSWSLNIKAEETFVVAAVLDPSATDVMTPISEPFSKEYTFAGEVSGEINLPKRVYATGEEIPVTITINNLKGSTIKSIEVGIQSDMAFKVTTGIKTNVPYLTENQTVKSFAVKTDDLNVKEGEKRVYTCKILLTKDFPSFSKENMPLISVNNFFYMKLSKEAFFSMSADQKIPLTLISAPAGSAIAESLNKLALTEDYGPPPAYSETEN